MRHHRWFVPRCISDPCYSCTPTRSCHRGLDKASLTPSDTSPPSPVPRDRGDRVRHLCSGGRAQPNPRFTDPRTREEKLCPALCHALRMKVSTRNGMCFAKEIPADAPTVLYLTGRYLPNWIGMISSRFPHSLLTIINDRNCIVCVHREVERRGGGNIGKEVDLKNHRTIDLSTISVSRSFFGRFLLFRICIFINDLSLGEKCSVNNIPFLFPESPKREGRGFDRAIVSGEYF